MLNSKTRNEAVNKLEKSIGKHESLRKEVGNSSVELFSERKRAAGEVIESVEAFVNRLANSPKEFKKSVAEYRVEVSRFDHTVHKIEAEATRIRKIGSATGGAGAMAGVGVAAFGPTAAMAIATTFGTASTGTAISTLSGAVATKAALAWLGGGALAAGGGGVAAGNALLAMAGPVGWTIGGVAIVGSGLFLHRRNGQIAEGATKERVKVEAEVRSLQIASREISSLTSLTRDHADGCLKDLSWLQSNAPTDYARFGAAERTRIGALINHINSLSELLSKEVAV
ncbi:MAG: hypothetical protein H0U74_04795 [Bradymonadaceae bacterium]|nr:hypothetical protein [Lujinxingiaceae bacterium]